eukprot:TCALIF_13869-PA protein Name:"Protein of unknown function" AED:0.27 eAED:0.27 QI:11/0.5/0.2/0.6/0.75/0.6/5/0/193
MDRGCSGNAKLDFSFTGAASTRIFEIKATQIECGSRSAPPDGCLQYHTNLDGRFQTFNFEPIDESHLKAQNYAICIRQELGYCCVEYSVCPDVEDTGFTLGVNDEGMAYQDNDCASFDFIGIEGSSSTCQQSGNQATLWSRYCGDKLNVITMGIVHVPICDCSPPFQVRIFANEQSDKIDDPADETPNDLFSR